MTDRNADVRSIAKLGRFGTILFLTIAGLLIAHIALIHAVHSKQYAAGALRELVGQQSSDLRQIGRAAQSVLLYGEAGDSTPMLVQHEMAMIRKLSAAVAERDREISSLFDTLNRPVEWLRLEATEEQAYRSVMSSFLSRVWELSSGRNIPATRIWTLPDLAVSPFGVLMSYLQKLDESSRLFDEKWRFVELLAAIASFVVVLLLAGLLVFNYFRPLCVRAQRDFTDLQESLSVRTRYFYQASHELKTPLNVINGYSQVLSQTAGDSDSAARRYAESILQAGTILTQRIDDILLLGELQAGTYATVDEPIDLAEIARSAKDAMIQNADKIDIIDLRPRAEPIHSDPAAVRIMLIHLLRNATYHSVDGCVLRISMVGEDQVVEIVDDGPGIARADLDRVMKPFHTVANGEAKADTGLGLGLAIVDGLSRVNRVQIEMETDPHRGTAVRLRFAPQGKATSGRPAGFHLRRLTSAAGADLKCT